MRHSEVLVKLINDKQFRVIVELGVYSGHTTKFLLRNCMCITKYFAIDTWNVVPQNNGINYGKMAFYTQDFWDAMYNKVSQLASHFPALQIIRSSSLKAYSLFQDAVMDLVYIDTTHTYSDTIKEITAWLPLVRKGGVIAGHDYGTGKRKGYAVDLAVNAFFGSTNISVYDDGVWVKTL